MKKNSVFSSCILLGASVGLMGNGSCVPPLALSKGDNAISPATPVDGVDTVAQCPSFAAYQLKADPVIQRLCVSCHAPGGAGAAKYQVSAGSSSDTFVASTNFVSSRAEAV